MKHVYNDGGRSAAGFKDRAAGDCVTRAIAIATGLPYRMVYDDINAMAENERSHKRGRSSARNGVHKGLKRKFLERQGWRWVPTMHIGSGCKVHLRENELPKGRIIVALSHHSAAVVDGVLHDTYDCSRGGTRCVYGYFMKECSPQWALPVMLLD